MKKQYLAGFSTIVGVYLMLALGASAQSLNANLDASVNSNAGIEVEVKGNATSSTKGSGGVSGSSGNTVSASASSVRGWSESEKQEFLTTVKAEAELKSGQELNNFAKGVMLKDKNVAGVEADETKVEVKYKLPAKFLGVFGGSLSAITNVSFETSKTGRGPKEVTVRFPWYRMFFSLASSTQEAVLKEAIAAQVEVNAQVPRDNTYAQNGVTINIISSILKSLRAKIEASVE